MEGLVISLLSVVSLFLLFLCIVFFWPPLSIYVPVLWNLIKFKIILKKITKDARSRSQIAGLKRIKQLWLFFTELCREKADRMGGFSSSFLYDIEKIKNTMNEHLKEIESIVKIYNLNEEIILKLRKLFIEKVYISALKRKNYQWAASFAKTNSL